MKKSEPSILASIIGFSALPSMVFVVLLVAKLTTWPSLHWVWVTSPIWGAVGMFLILWAYVYAVLASKKIP